MAEIAKVWRPTLPQEVLKLAQAKAALLAKELHQRVTTDEILASVNPAVLADTTRGDRKRVASIYPPVSDPVRLNTALMYAQRDGRKRTPNPGLLTQ